MQWSHTALDIYGLEEQVPKTVVYGQTGDISSLCEFEWFEWVMFFQRKETYLDDKMFIGTWIGPAIDVGTAMTYKILRPDGGYVCRSTLGYWTSNEESNPVRMAKCVSVMKQLNSCIGHAAKLSDFPLNDLTPEFEYYMDGVEDVFEGTPDEIKEAPPPTPEASENYDVSQLQLPRDQSLAQGRVLKHAPDNDDNVIGHANKNPILDTRGYVVEFKDVE